jgi:hypothetical protein
MGSREMKVKINVHAIETDNVTGKLQAGRVLRSAEYITDSVPRCLQQAEHDMSVSIDETISYTVIE